MGCSRTLSPPLHGQLHIHRRRSDDGRPIQCYLLLLLGWICRFNPLRDSMNRGWQWRWRRGLWWRRLLNLLHHLPLLWLLQLLEWLLCHHWEVEGLATGKLRVRSPQ